MLGEEAYAHLVLGTKPHEKGAAPYVAEADDAADGMDGNAQPHIAVNLDHHCLALFGEIGTLGSHIEGVQESFHVSPAVSLIRARYRFTESLFFELLGHAVSDKRASLAPLGINGRRGDATHDQCAGFLRRLFRLTPKRFIEAHVGPSARLAIEEGPLRHGNREHLLKAHYLGAKLHRVAMVGLGLAPLVLYGKGLPAVFVDPAELHHVRDADKAEPHGAQRHAARDPGRTAGLVAFLVDFLVHDAAFGSEAALGPNLLDVDKGALPGTEDIVLQGGDHDEFVFGVTHGFFHGPRA